MLYNCFFCLCVELLLKPNTAASVVYDNCPIDLHVEQVLNGMNVPADCSAVLLHNIEEILRIIYELEEKHKAYLRQRLKRLNYGSRYGSFALRTKFSMF